MKKIKQLWSHNYELYRFHLPIICQKAKGQHVKTIAVEDIKRSLRSLEVLMT